MAKVNKYNRRTDIIPVHLPTHWSLILVTAQQEILRTAAAAAEVARQRTVRCVFYRFNVLLAHHIRANRYILCV